MKTKYNDLGDVVEESYYDANEQLTDTTMGYAMAAYTYDDLGNQTSEEYYNSRQLGATSAETGYSHSLIVYDEEGRLTDEEYFSEADERINNKKGYSEHHIRYTDSGRIAEEYYRTAAGGPYMSADGYTKRELITEEPQYGAYEMRLEKSVPTEEQGVAYSIADFDKYDRIIRQKYFNEDGSAAVGPEGCSMVEYGYTTTGNISEIHYYDADGNPTEVDGVFGVESEYNGYGNLEQ
jgi:hypothetical protein